MITTFWWGCVCCEENLVVLWLWSQLCVFAFAIDFFRRYRRKKISFVSIWLSLQILGLSQEVFQFFFLLSLLAQVKCKKRQEKRLSTSVRGLWLLVVNVSMTLTQIVLITHDCLVSSVEFVWVCLCFLSFRIDSDLYKVTDWIFGMSWTLWVDRVRHTFSWSNKKRRQE